MEITAKFTEGALLRLPSSHKNSDAVDTSVLLLALLPLLFGLQKLKGLQLSATGRLTQARGHCSRGRTHDSGARSEENVGLEMASVQKISFIVLAACCTILHHVNAGVIDRTQGEREFLSNFVSMTFDC